MSLTTDSVNSSFCRLQQICQTLHDPEISTHLNDVHSEIHAVNHEILFVVYPLFRAFESARDHIEQASLNREKVETLTITYLNWADYGLRFGNKIAEAMASLNQLSETDSGQAEFAKRPGIMKDVTALSVFANTLGVIIKGNNVLMAKRRFDQSSYDVSEAAQSVLTDLGGVIDAYEKLPGGNQMALAMGFGRVHRDGVENMLTKLKANLESAQRPDIRD